MTTPEGETVSVAAISLSAQQVVLDDGTILEMDTLIDDEGDETDDIELAVVAVVQLTNGKWFVVKFDDFEFDEKTLN